MKSSRDKNYPNIKRMIILFLLMVSLSAGYLFIVNQNISEDAPRAHGGVIDLTNIDTDQIVRLDGQWEFYPGILLTPDMELPVSKYIEVPGSWDKALRGKSEGVGTYRLVIRVPKDGLYALKTRTLRLASIIYANGLEVISTGKIGYSKDDFESESKYRFTSAVAEDGQIELLIPMSSFNYKTGGIIKSIEFGEYSALQHRHNISRAIEAFALSTYYVFGFYFLFVFYRGNRQRYNLFFGLSFIAMAFNLSTMNEQLLDMIVNYDFNFRLILQIFSIQFSSIFLLLGTHCFLRKYSSERVVKLIIGINLLTLLFIFIDFSKAIITTKNLLQSSLVISYLIDYVYILTVLIKAIIKKDEYSEILSVITISYITYWVIIGLKIILEIDTRNIQFFLMTLIFVGVGLLINRQQEKERERLKELTNKLTLDEKLRKAFLKNATDKLKEPLTNIERHLNKVYKGEGGLLTPEQHRDLVAMNMEVKAIERLVEDIDEASVLGEERGDIRVRGIDSYRLVGDVVEQIRPMGKIKNIGLYNEIEKDFPKILADPGKFSQILYNLLYNAIENTFEGEIRVAAELEGSMVRFSIIDTGKGISENELDSIFDLFYRGDEEESGLGLGLAVVKNLVVAQGGRVKVESVLGQGSTFNFTLPIYSIEEPQKKEVAQVLVETQGVHFSWAEGRNILVTNIFEIDEYKDYFKESNLGLFFAGDEFEVLEILRGEAIDLLIVDLTHRDNNNMLVLEKVRKRYSLAELPILALVGYGNRIEFSKVSEYGINDSLRKPFEKEELISRVSSLLLMKSSVEEGLEKEFRYFYSQISPHFLYNTLNTIIMLSYKDEEKTRQALYNLSTYFRGKLDLHRESGQISIKDELDLVRAYLEIEKLRFGERLKISFEIDENIRGSIPPLTIQPLVENAIKHGLKKKEMGEIIVRAQVFEGYNHIEIIDNGVGMEAKKIEEIQEGGAGGLGLRNTIKKLGIIKGASFNIYSDLGQGTRMTISIPEVISESNNN